jgi:hypothetical protein
MASSGGLATRQSKQLAEKFEAERKEIAPQSKSKNGNWYPGSGPSQVLLWATEDQKYIEEDFR